MTPSKPGDPQKGKPAEKEQAEVQAKEAKEAAATEAAATEAAADAPAEEAPKPRRRRRPPAKPGAEDAAEEPAAKAAEPAEEAAEPVEEAAEPVEEAPESAEEAPEPVASADEDEEAAEPAAPAARREPRGATKTAAPRGRDGRVLVRAQAKYVRTSARKARLVADHVRGKSVQDARAILAHTPRAAARDWSKLLESAVANAEHNHELVGDDLRIWAITADEGPTLKRFRPRALGRATRIRKRTSHLTIQLTPKETR
jgi:ribosomal protein L22